MHRQSKMSSTCPRPTVLLFSLKASRRLTAGLRLLPRLLLILFVEYTAIFIQVQNNHHIWIRLVPGFFSADQKNRGLLDPSKSVTLHWIDVNECRMETKLQKESSFKMEKGIWLKLWNFRPIFYAVLTRVMFFIHGFMSVWLLAHCFNNAMYWVTILGIVLLFFEMVYTLLARKGQEYK